MNCILPAHLKGLSLPLHANYSHRRWPQWRNLGTNKAILVALSLFNNVAASVSYCIEWCRKFLPKRRPQWRSLGPNKTTLVARRY